MLAIKFSSANVSVNFAAIIALFLFLQKFVYFRSQVVLCLSRKSINSICCFIMAAILSYKCEEPKLDPTKWLISFSLEGEQTKLKADGIDRKGSTLGHV